MGRMKMNDRSVEDAYRRHNYCAYDATLIDVLVVRESGKFASRARKKILRYECEFCGAEYDISFLLDQK